MTTSQRPVTSPFQTVPPGHHEVSPSKTELLTSENAPNVPRGRLYEAFLELSRQRASQKTQEGNGQKVTNKTTIEQQSPDSASDRMSLDEPVHTAIVPLDNVVGVKPLPRTPNIALKEPPCICKKGEQSPRDFSASQYAAASIGCTIKPPYDETLINNSDTLGHKKECPCFEGPRASANSTPNGHATAAQSQNNGSQFLSAQARSFTPSHASESDVSMSTISPNPMEASPGIQRSFNMIVDDRTLG